MKTILQAAAFIALFPLTIPAQAQAAEALRWSCNGTDTTNETPVQFDLVLADHDGSDYTYKAVENFFYNGSKTSDLDLSKEVVSCGKADDGEERQGFQSWSLENEKFNLYSGCENEALELEARCQKQ